MSKTPDPENNVQPDIAGYLHAEAPLPGHRETDTSLPPEDDSMRDMEKSLVERIADVDDDRRRTAVQLQKALNTHRDETRAALRRGLNGILAAVGLITLLLAGAIGWGLWQQAELRDRQIAALADLDGRLASLSATVARLDARDEAATLPATPDGAPEQALLSELGGRVDELSALIGGLSGSVAELEGKRQASADNGARGRAELEPISDQQAHLAAELASLKTALAALPDQARAAAETTAREIAAEAEATTRQAAIDAARVAAAEALRDAPPASAGTIAGAQAATMSAADLDRVIDEQLARLEREYQRLAREVASPAVRQQSSAATAGGQGPAGAGAEPSSTRPQASRARQADEQAGPSQSDAALPSQVRVGDRRYALQLIGFYSRAELDAFVADSPLPARVYALEETFRGQPWFALIHSLYPDLAAATAAEDALPPALARLDIWIRDLPPDGQLSVIETTASN